MDWNELAIVVGMAAAISGLGAAVVSVLDGFRRRRTRGRIRFELETAADLVKVESKESLDHKINRAQQLSTEAARLNAEVKGEFDLQFAAARQAQADAARARQDADEAEAAARAYESAVTAAKEVIATELEGVVTKNAKSERKFQIWLSAASFAGGVAATVVVTLLFQALAR